MIAAIGMAKDEADVARWVILHLLAEGVDEVLVADNRSTDHTRSILEELAREYPVHVVDDPVVAYQQAAKMTALAHKMGERGAEWIVPFDFDEIWLADHGTLAEYLRSSPADILTAVGWDHVAKPDDEPHDNPFLRSPWRRSYPQTLPKVAFRYHPEAAIQMGNHDVFRPGRRDNGLSLRQVQYRSLEQLKRKLRNGAAAYAASDVHELHGTHWREWDGRPDEDFADYWARLQAETDLVYDPIPCRSL